MNRDVGRVLREVLIPWLCCYGATSVAFLFFLNNFDTLCVGFWSFGFSVVMMILGFGGVLLSTERLMKVLGGLCLAGKVPFWMCVFWWLYTEDRDPLSLIGGCLVGLALTACVFWVAGSVGQESSGGCAEKAV